MSKLTCSAHHGPQGRQCKATSNLTRVLIKPTTTSPHGGSLHLPDLAVITLCPKHFVLNIFESKSQPGGEGQ